MLLAAAPAFAAEPETCATVRLAEVGWTDIAATTGVAVTLLQALGYETETELLALPVTFQSLARGDIDVFLGQWMPTMETLIRPYLDSGEIDVVRVNLEGAKYTLATTTTLADQGLTDFADIAKFKDQLDGKIYGIEPGNDGNKIIADMIAQNAFGLGDFKLVESSEQAMLAQAERAVGDKEDRLPRLGAASDEHEAPHDLSRRRRRLVRPGLRRLDRLDLRAGGLRRRMP